MGLFQSAVIKKYLKEAEDKTSLLYRQWRAQIHVFFSEWNFWFFFRKKKLYL